METIIIFFFLTALHSEGVDKSVGKRKKKQKKNSCGCLSVLVVEEAEDQNQKNATKKERKMKKRVQVVRNSHSFVHVLGTESW